MKNELAISSFALRGLLGPIRITRRMPDGTKQQTAWGDQPAKVSLLDLPRQVKERLGLNAIEICQFHMESDAPEYVAKLKRALEDARMPLVNVPIDVGNISDPNERYREEDLAEIEGWMRVAAQLGSRMVRVNASGFQGEHAPIEVTIASYKRLAKTAKELGMTLLIENHGGITTDPEVIVKIVEAVDGMKTLVDIGNFEPMMSAGSARFRGEEPPKNVDFEPMYPQIARIAPYAGMVHVKTYELDERGRPVGLDVVRALQIVRDAGFTGPISLESEGGEGDPWQNAAWTKQLVEEAFA